MLAGKEKKHNAKEAVFILSAQFDQFYWLYTPVQALLQSRYRIWVVDFYFKLVVLVK